MNTKGEGRLGWHQATPSTSNNNSKSSHSTSRAKATIVTLALWGWNPVAAAVWLIEHGGLRDA